MGELRHYARRGETDCGSAVEIVDRQFNFIRCILPYDYRWTSNSQQWDEAERICAALEGPMQALGVVSIEPRPAENNAASPSEASAGSLPPDEPQSPAIRSDLEGKS